ncbi:hypothetical protein D3C76_1433830 [compost metagenome]
MNSVSHEVIKQAGSIDRAAVRKVTAMGQVHPENGIPRLQSRKVNGQVRLSAGVRLYVSMLSAKQFLRTIARDIFHDIDMLAAAIVAFAGISFRIFVCQYGAHCFHNSFADNVLGCDQFNVVPLTFELQIHRFQYRRVLLSQLIHVS